jgi:ABC-2 type transport system ATP-binding protein
MSEQQPVTSTLAIETDQLAKQYLGQGGQPIQAVRGVDLAIRRGEIYALLGPNGAGKTTTIAMLTTLLTPSAGTARVAGYDVVQQAAEVRRRIGVTFQEVVLDQDLTGRQVLDFHGQLYGLSRGRRQEQITALGSLVELSEALDRPAAQYSGGMKRRLELARGLMTAPSILFLDEPTQGLDPQNRVGIWEYIRQLRNEQGLTLLLTTHYMEEAEALADRVGILDQGMLVVEGTPAVLIRQLGADMILIRGQGDATGLAERLQQAEFVTQVTQHPLNEAEQQLQIGVDAGERRLVQVIELAQASGFAIGEISVAKPSLADVFLKYTGRALRDQ